MNSIPLWLRLLRAYCHYSPVTRGKWRLVLWAYRYLDVPDIIVESTLDHSLKLKLHLRIWVDFNIYCIGLYEHYLANFFKRQLKPDTVFLDVGAYIGQYALLAARGAPQGHIYAFEPNPESARRLRDIANYNHLSNIEVINKAVGERIGTVSFYIPQQPFQSSVVASHAAYQQIVKVSITSLDAFCAEKELAHVDIIKIDVEEAENEVIRGALTLLKNARPLVIIEIGRKSLEAGEPESLRQLKSLQYKFFILRRNQLLPLSGQISPGTNVIAIPDQEAPNLSV